MTRAPRAAAGARPAHPGGVVCRVVRHAIAMGRAWRSSRCPPLWLAIALLRGGGARTGFWAGVLALLWFSHGVMVAWTRPPERAFALGEVALSVAIVLAASLTGLRGTFRRAIEAQSTRPEPMATLLPSSDPRMAGLPADAIARMHGAARAIRDGALARCRAPARAACWRDPRTSGGAAPARPPARPRPRPADGDALLQRALASLSRRRAAAQRHGQLQMACGDAEAAFAQLAPRLRLGAGATDAVVQPRPQPADAGRQRRRGRSAGSSASTLAPDLLPATILLGDALVHLGRFDEAAGALSRRPAAPPGAAATHGAACPTSRRGRCRTHDAEQLVAQLQRQRHHRRRPRRDGPCARQTGGRPRPLSARRSPRWRPANALAAAARAVERVGIRGATSMRRWPRPSGCPRRRSGSRTAKSSSSSALPRSGSTLFEQILAHASRRRRRERTARPWRNDPAGIAAARAALSAMDRVGDARRTGSDWARTTCPAPRAGARGDRASPTRCRTTGNTPASCARCCRARPSSTCVATALETALVVLSPAVLPAAGFLGRPLPTSPPTCAVANARWTPGAPAIPPHPPASLRGAAGRPGGRIRALLDDCGLPFDAACLEFHRSQRSVRTASAAQVRQPLRGDTARAICTARSWIPCARRSAASRPGRAAGTRFAQNARMEELLIVTTGGTIDKVYFDDKSDYQVGEPQIGHILEELGVAFRFRVIPILRKDSLHIDAADRELLRATIAAHRRTARAGHPWHRHDGRDRARCWRASPARRSCSPAR